MADSNPLIDTNAAINKIGNFATLFANHGASFVTDISKTDFVNDLGGDGLKDLGMKGADMMRKNKYVTTAIGMLGAGEIIAGMSNALSD